MVDFSSNLKELRLKYKMTQKELADKIGVSHNNHSSEKILLFYKI